MEYRITYPDYEWVFKTKDEGVAKEIAQVCPDDTICECWDSNELVERLLLLDIFNKK